MSPNATAHIIEKIAAFGWHVVVYFEAADLAEKWDFFTSLPTIVVVVLLATVPWMDAGAIVTAVAVKFPAESTVP